MRDLMLAAGASVALALCSTALAGENANDLLNRAPENANSLIYVDLMGLRTCQFGTKQGWAKQNERDFNGGASGIPPCAQQILIASYLDPSTLEKTWDVTLLKLDTPVTPVQLARREAGEIDAKDPDLITSPRNAFFTVFDPTLVGARSPANRQEMARWRRFAAKSTGPVVSPFLQQAMKAADGKQILLAVDLTDVLDSPGVRARLKNARALLGRKVDLDDLTNLIVTLKGITLTVAAGTALEGEMRVEFGIRPNAMSAFGGPLVAEALGAAGFDVEDIVKWDFKIEDNAVVLRGKFPETGLRSMLMPLTPTVLTPASSAAEKTESNDPKAYTSQKYFRSLKTMLDELQEGKNNRSQSRIAYLYKEYSRKIDELPVLNVDPELLKFSASVSLTVRELSNQARLQDRKGTALASNISEGMVTTPNAYQFYGGGPGWSYQFSAPSYDWQSNRQQITNMMALGNLSESARRNETWKTVNNETAKLRQALTAKYNIEF